MHKKISNYRFASLTTPIVLCLCVCLLATSVVQAQKTPKIFTTEQANSTASTNLSYVNALEGEYRNATDPVEKKLLRNRLIYIGVEQIDTEFNAFRKNSRKRNDLLQFLFDFLEIGVSTTISVINGERAKTVLAEALTGFKGTRTAVNKNFRLMETQILFNKMVANRAKRLELIYGKLNQDSDSYPWERARTELKDYFYAGTIDEALNSLSIDTGAEATVATAKVERLKIKTLDQLTSAVTCDKNRIALFAKAKAGDAAALTKLKEAVKANLELAPGKNATDIDALNVAGLEALYKDILRRFLDTPDSTQGLCDAMKP